VDLTVEVMLPARGANDFATSANARWRVLAPVAVYTRRAPSTVGMPLTGYIHVNGVPLPPAWADWSEERALQRMNNILCEFWNDGERRIWCGDHTVLGAGARNALLTDRQLTVTWAQFKAAMRHLVRDARLADADLG
jgi:hypothetical protein